MYISWHGQNCFKIQSEKNTLIIDPFDPKKTGLKLNAPKADIVTLTDPEIDSKEVKPIAEDIFKITSPGEYEVKGIFIYAIKLKDKEELIYHIESEQVSIGHLGHLNRTLGEQELEQLNGIDILMIPVGGNSVLDAKKATDLISQIEPRIVIPMHYALPGLKEKLDSVDKFCKEIGSCEKDKLDKLKITKKDLPAEETKYYVLNPWNLLISKFQITNNK